MKQFDIYVGVNGEEATSHGAEYVFEGYGPADALARFVADPDAIAELRGHRPNFEQLVAFDDEESASMFPLDDGSWELHAYVDEADVVVTIPPTEHVSITDAADMLGVSRQRVHVMLRGGQLHGRKVGTTWMVSLASVARRMNP